MWVKFTFTDPYGLESMILWCKCPAKPTSDGGLEGWHSRGVAWHFEYWSGLGTGSGVACPWLPQLCRGPKSFKKVKKFSRWTINCVIYFSHSIILREYSTIFWEPLPEMKFADKLENYSGSLFLVEFSSRGIKLIVPWRPLKNMGMSYRGQQWSKKWKKNSTWKDGRFIRWSRFPGGTEFCLVLRLDSD